jgi:DNA-binding winged helix-turn-helix (wHTH) protein
MDGVTYRFGPFSINSGPRLLFRDGQRLALPPKAADLLIVLLQRKGQLVTKDELLKEVWPDTIVEEGNLARHIFLLRKILDDSDADGYIETVPKRGYRFSAPLQVEPGTVAALIAEEHTSERIVIEETETTEAPKAPAVRPRVAITVTLAVLVSLFALLLWNRARGVTPVRSLLVLPFANLSMAGDAEYYSDGLTEELIGALRTVRGLRVVPRTTSFQFKGKSADVRAIGRQLEADAVLDGGVQREGDRLRIRLSHSQAWATVVRFGHRSTTVNLRIFSLLSRKSHAVC